MASRWRGVGGAGPPSGWSSFGNLMLAPSAIRKLGETQQQALKAGHRWSPPKVRPLPPSYREDSGLQRVTMKRRFWFGGLVAQVYPFKSVPLRLGPRTS